MQDVAQMKPSKDVSKICSASEKQRPLLFGENMKMSTPKACPQAEVFSLLWILVIQELFNEKHAYFQGYADDIASCITG